MRLRTILLAGMIGIVGCDRGVEDVRVQSAPKQPPPSMQAAVSPAAAPAQAPAGDPHAHADAPIHWTVPAGWKEQPGGQMRFAAFQITDDPNIVLTVIPLAGDSGSLVANVNRWEGQIGLPPSPEAELGKVVTRIEVEGKPVDIIDLTGPESANPRLRMLAAIIPHEGSTWFFKVTGPADVIAAQKSNFDAFIKSVHFTHDHHHHAHGGGDPHAGMAHGVDPHGAVASNTDIQYTQPQEWNKDEPRPMRHVSFTGDGVEMVISKLPAIGSGSYLDNVNRWRGQVGLPAITDGSQQKSEPIQIGGAAAVLFDFTGPGDAASAKRMLVAVAPAGTELWFFRFSGTSAAIEKQRASFDSFIKSIQFVGGNRDAKPQ